ncbi:valine--tRNA ligase [Candidatus Kuenenbacteria bacterium CG11_big_fil_rev_8_21_14_0_20_37_9]|uniref:Valine--tRNA ligase n=2 Tax=Candidatus Kueneniibacteriota TaxID=1752740 RepID=A0A2M6XRU2_9BACT|nr:MAG: valine--tRNA ligase [Candidatus Kuenenbacteria bacterium CG1_02_38_13]PIR05379.1 MAG: valine--tRNA ligase [Candidatus Kuenenbacteria bacterium CG11_big_fil_rev_8_21_14_0_20_37_9]PIU10364.1 MAG: valine--tRNA ligase [Candidatus Kuenenbacteria bacterium CG08_land_8_20_14_0_20_37_23]
MSLPKAYTPKEYEDEIYGKWEKSGYFNPDNLDLPDDVPIFTISMPPPNATGQLHVGHTLGIALQDIMARYHRMRGDRTLWLPGVDHAAIATQNVVEKLLKKEGTSRHKIGREKFLRRVQEYVSQSKSTIENQTRKMGASCDWSRENYTMSPELSHAVHMQFKKMYDDGLIYRGERIVNWCPRCHSTLADDEVEHVEQKTKLYWIKYGPFILATTRPETKLGDTAVAVHPSDKRYKNMVGKKYQILGVLGKFEITVIADNAVDKNFGSGAVKVTPSHSFVDAEMAKKNNIPGKQIIDEDGLMMENCGKYAGMKTLEAREAIVKDMTIMGLIDHIDENYQHNLSICYRCQTPIEPLPSWQWFVAVDKEFKLKNKDLIKKFGKERATLKEISKWAVESGTIDIVPERFKKIYYQWMENLHDWCISRQIWFGHRVPVWYRGKKNDDEIYVGLEAPKRDGWIQDEDTLDTWFSSALWTWSTLLNKKDYQKYGRLEEWVEESPDLKNFHPTSVMETMHDIIFFWVARMIMMTLHAINQIPFKTVYLHGMVCDRHGKKMSKSKPETCIEPIAVSGKYGTDALRLSLIIGNTPGNPLRLSEQKIVSFRNFSNKLWNIGRFIEFNSEKNNFKEENEFETKTLADKWIMSKFNSLIAEATGDIDNYHFSHAGEKLYDFAWHALADWYIEIAKLQNDQNTHNLAHHVYVNLLKLLHPFTPFVTEKIYESFGAGKMLLIENWPIADDKKINSQAEQDFIIVQELIANIRLWKKDNRIGQNEIIKLQIAGADKIINSELSMINHLAKAEIKIISILAKSDFEVRNLKVSMVK